RNDSATGLVLGGHDDPAAIRFVGGQTEVLPPQARDLGGSESSKPGDGDKGEQGRRLFVRGQEQFLHVRGAIDHGVVVAGVGAPFYSVVLIPCLGQELVVLAPFEEGHQRAPVAVEGRALSPTVVEPCLESLTSDG